VSTLAAVLLAVYIAGALSAVRLSLDLDPDGELLYLAPWQRLAWFFAFVAVWPLVLAVVVAMSAGAAAVTRTARRPL
jgi:hypothetical protein